MPGVHPVTYPPLVSNMADSSLQCEATKKDGCRCTGRAQPGDTYCAFHSPKLAAKRAAGRRQGGKAQKGAVLPADTPDEPLADFADVRKFLGLTINQVRKGILCPKVANSIGLLVGQLLRAIEAKVNEEFDERLTRLEEMLAERQRAPDPSNNGQSRWENCPDVPTFNGG